MFCLNNEEKNGKIEFEKRGKQNHQNGGQRKE